MKIICLFVIISYVTCGTPPNSTTPSAINTVWIMLCGFLVMFMQLGFAMLETGTCRSKNAQHVLLKNLVDICVGALCWWAIGFALAYGYEINSEGEVVRGTKFSGNSGYFTLNFMSFGDAPIPTGMDLFDYSNWFFQWAFCATAATIVSGGVVERVQFGGYVVFSLMMSAFIYPLVVAWTWSGHGFLSDITGISGKYYDFAGSGIVHLTGGVGALVGAIISGPRKNRWSSNSSEFDPHSVPLVVLGTIILWFGWYGFNCGSTLSIEDGLVSTRVGLIAVNTTLSASVGGLFSFIIKYITPTISNSRFKFQTSAFDVPGFCNGILAGLVSITAGCANVFPGSALAIGIIGTFFYMISSWIVRRLRIDDPLDAFSVHGVPGLWGVLAAPLFDFARGTSVISTQTSYLNGQYSSDAGVGDVFVANLTGVVCIIVWVSLTSAIVFGSLKILGLLNCEDIHQDTGTDAIHHKPARAYSISTVPTFNG